MELGDLRSYEALLKPFKAPWCFGGGWACDAWVGRATRPHGDVDIVIWRQDQIAFRAAFAGWQWQSHTNGETRDWPLGTYLELPCHNAHGSFQDEAFEVLMIEREEGDWWYRRNPLVRMPVTRAMLSSPLGVSVLNPAIALLFKSKRPEAKDHHDFEMVSPCLSAQDRSWLKQALTVAHPHHIWISFL